MFEALLKGLAARGHQVHVVGHFPQKKQITNYIDISVEGSLHTLVNNVTVPSAVTLGTFFNGVVFSFKNLIDKCEKVFEHSKVQELIKSNDTFDLIITELYGPDCFLGFSQRFNAPLINIVSSVIFPWGNDRIANPDNPSYIPNYFIPYTHNMTFGQRIINTVLTEILKLGHYMLLEIRMEKMHKKYFGQDTPPLSELKKRTSLILVNSHSSLNNPRPTVPGFVEVGGLHIQSGGKLPEVR
jgi:glucuronosyltransferase